MGKYVNNFGRSGVISGGIYSVIFFLIFKEFGTAIVIGAFMGVISTGFFRILGLNKDEGEVALERKQNNTEYSLQGTVSDSFSDIEKLGKKRKEVYETYKELLNQQEVSEETFDDVLATTMITMITILENEYMSSQNISQLEAYEKSLSTILSYPPNKFFKPD